MKGNKLETIDEMHTPILLEKYLDWELHNIKSCMTDKKVKDRIFAILDLGLNLK